MPSVLMYACISVVLVAVVTPLLRRCLFWTWSAPKRRRLAGVRRGVPSQRGRLRQQLPPRRGPGRLVRLRQAHASRTSCRRLKPTSRGEAGGGVGTAPPLVPHRSPLAGWGPESTGSRMIASRGPEPPPSCRHGLHAFTPATTRTASSGPPTRMRGAHDEGAAVGGGGGHGRANSCSGESRDSKDWSKQGFYAPRSPRKTLETVALLDLVYETDTLTKTTLSSSVKRSPRTYSAAFRSQVQRGLSPRALRFKVTANSARRLWALASKRWSLIHSPPQPGCPTSYLRLVPGTTIRLGRQGCRCVRRGRVAPGTGRPRPPDQ